MESSSIFPLHNRYFETRRGILYNGEVLEVLKSLPDNSIDCIITSPPYWGLRDYGVDGQIGLEPALDQYLNNLLQVTNELKRVLKPTGVMFWNHGDSYSARSTHRNKKGVTNYDNLDPTYGSRTGRKVRYTTKFNDGLPEKTLVLQNYRLIIKMIDEQGWILRNTIVWRKPNAMPSSVKDRFSNSYEPVFMLVKNKKYWFDLDAVRVPHKESSLQRYKYGLNSIYAKAENYGGRQNNNISNCERMGDFVNPLGKNPGDVWTVPTQPFPEAHFATFPMRLIEPMIKAGCPQWVCKKCGRPREKILERIPKQGEASPTTGKYTKNNQAHSAGSREKYHTEVRRFHLPKSTMIAFAKWLKRHIEGNAHTLDKVFGRDKWTHWVRTDNSGQSLPSPEDYKKLKEILSLPDDWDTYMLETIQTLVDDTGGSYKTYKWADYCACESTEWEAGIVLDPFMGSGTTAVVATQLDRNWIGIELNPEYCEMVKKRTQKASKKRAPLLT